MSLTAADVMSTVSDAVNDSETAANFQPQTLFSYLNDALLAFYQLKPDISTVAEAYQLTAGKTMQSLPTGGTILFDLAYNTTAADGTPGAHIRLIKDREAFNVRNPNWRTAMTASATVKYYFYDQNNPTQFEVVPIQHDTTPGYVFIVYGKPPTLMSAPGSGEDVIASYTASIPIGDEYKDALVNYVVYRIYESMGSKSQDSVAKMTAAEQRYLRFLGVVDAAEEAKAPKSN